MATYGEACAAARRIAKETGRQVHVIHNRGGVDGYEACMEGAPYADASRHGWSDIQVLQPAS